MKHFPHYALVALLALLGLDSCEHISTEHVRQFTSITREIGGRFGEDFGYRLAGNNGRERGREIGRHTGEAFGNYLCKVWESSFVKPRQEYATPQEYVQANQQQLNSRINSARKANVALSAKKKSSTPISRNELAQIEQATAANDALIRQDIATAHSAMQEASPKERKELSAQVSILEQERTHMSGQAQALKQHQV